MLATLEYAQKLGSRYALKTTLLAQIAVNVIFFVFLLTITQSTRMFLDIITYLGVVNCAVFLVSSLLYAYLVGKKAGVKIIVKKKRFAWVGLISGLKVALFATLTCSFATVLLQASWVQVEADWLLNYLVKPFAWTAAACFIPILLAGIWYGYQLKTQADA